MSGGCDAIFKVKWSSGNHRGVAQFTAGIMILYPSIEQHFYRMVNSGVTQARIVFNPAYPGTYAYLEVFVSSSLDFKIDIEMSGAGGWTLLTPSTLGGIPEGYTQDTVVFKAPITEGTFPKVTFNQNGRITAGSALVSADIPSSVALAGVPTAPTAANGTNTTQLATTAFVYGLASKTGNGYLKLPNGLIFQWGRSTFISGGETVTFPIAFPVACVNIQVTNRYDGATTSSYQVSNITDASFKLQGYSEGVHSDWFAIGF